MQPEYPVQFAAGLRSGSSSIAKAEAYGLKTSDVASAVASADVVMVLTPDEFQAQLYREIEPNLKQGATLAFAHGFAIHANQTVPRKDLDVIMVAPKAPGHTVRTEFTKGGGIPDLTVIFQDASGNAKNGSVLRQRHRRRPYRYHRPSRTKPKPICSVSRRFCAVVRLSWLKPA